MLICVIWQFYYFSYSGRWATMKKSYKLHIASGMTKNWISKYFPLFANVLCVKSHKQVLHTMYFAIDHPDKFQPVFEKKGITNSVRDIFKSQKSMKQCFIGTQQLKPSNFGTSDACFYSRLNFKTFVLKLDYNR